MLNQLARLSVEADGRYATDEELQFLKDYIQSFEQRLSAYQKIQANETEIVSQVKAQMRASHPNLFFKGNRDMTSTCERDRMKVLRYSAAALLSNDLDRLRENLLLWYQTVIRAFQDEQASQATYRVLQQVVEQYLTPEEAALFSSILGLNQIILGK